MKTRIQSIQARIHKSALESGRDPESVRLIGISKTKPHTLVKEAYDLGIRDFGENYMQEAVLKIAELGDSIPEAKWHFVGPLQSNKAKDLAKNFDYFHALDRLSLAKKIESQLEKEDRTINAFVQVNIDGEDSKSGVSPAELGPLLSDLASLTRIRVVGLMCIPSKQQANPNAPFRALRELQEAANSQNLYPNPLTELSMGMTQDFEAAVHEGATMIRIGTAIFGPRQ